MVSSSVKPKVISLRTRNGTQIYYRWQNGPVPQMPQKTNTWAFLGEKYRSCGTSACRNAQENSNTFMYLTSQTSLASQPWNPNSAADLCMKRSILGQKGQGLQFLLSFGKPQMDANLPQRNQEARRPCGHGVPSIGTSLAPTLGSHTHVPNITGMILEGSRRPPEILKAVHSQTKLAYGSRTRRHGCIPSFAVPTQDLMTEALTGWMPKSYVARTHGSVIADHVSP